MVAAKARRMRAADSYRLRQGWRDFFALGSGKARVAIERNETICRVEWKQLLAVICVGVFDILINPPNTK